MWPWIKLMRSYKVLRKYIEPMNEGEMLECFSVDNDNRLLKGIVCALRGLEEIAKENASIANQQESERTHYCGAMGAFREAQERILFLVEAGQIAAAKDRKRKVKK